MTSLPSRLQEAVAAAVDGTCLEPERLDDVRQELSSHAFDLFQAERLRDNNEAEAIERALRRLGDPAVVRRRLVWERVRAGFRRAGQFPTLIALLVVFDITAAIIRFVVETQDRFPGDRDRIAFLASACVVTSIYYWSAVVLFRLGTDIVRRRAGTRLVSEETVFGTGLMMVGICVWVLGRPGLMSMEFRHLFMWVPMWWQWWQTIAGVAIAATIVSGWWILQPRTQSVSERA